MNQAEIVNYFDQLAPNRAKWKRRNSYYYRYLNDFINFLVPTGKAIRRVEIGDSSFWRSDQVKRKNLVDYIVATDVLGYVDDIQDFMKNARDSLVADGRLVVTHYNTLWEPVLRLGSLIGLRMPVVEQNWLSLSDLKNFAYLSELEVVKSGTKLLLPKYVPLLSTFLNKVVANIWPFTRLGLFHYAVMRKQPLASVPQPSLSIIVPARNEAGTVEKIVLALLELGPLTEVIFIEGHSTDQTWAEIKRVADKYQGQKNIIFAQQTGQGKGDAVRAGFDLARGDILAIYDADMTVPAGAIEKFYRSAASRRGDFINGSRLVYPMADDSMRVLNYFGNKFFSLAFSLILGQPIKDTLCGTKVLWRQDYEAIKLNRSFFGDFDPFGDFDLLFGAAKLNLKIVDLPIRYQGRVYGDTNINRFRHGWLLLKMTIFAARKLRFI